MSNRLIFSAVVTAGMMMGSCSKDSVDPVTTDNGQAAMTYQMKAVNTSGNVNEKTTANGLLQWTSGYVNPREIKFEAKKKDLNIEYKSTNKARIDLFAPTPTDFGSFMIPAGIYKEIELKVKLQADGTDPALYLAGNYINNGLVIPVVFRVDEDLEIKTELKDVTIDDASSMAAITDLDLASYHAGITDAMLQNAQMTNGIIIISRNSNNSLYNIILNNLSARRHKCDFEKHH